MGGIFLVCPLKHYVVVTHWKCLKTPNTSQDTSNEWPQYNFRVVSGLPGAFYCICCLEVVTILEFETIKIAWPAND